jgi:2-amino-4-hydroxy-6-hydroxymethyldihydropteridine diphosphokinase
VAVALGSNLGDRQALLTEAVARLSPLLEGLRVSTFHDTTPVGVPDPQPNYLNAVAVGMTTRTPRELLDALMDIERALGRTRPHHAAPRTIDLDLILYGFAVVDEPALTLPHPRFRERAFVLAPLCEVAPDMVDPVSGKTASALLERLRTPG